MPELVNTISTAPALKTVHEGYLLREYIEGERGRLGEVSSLLNVPRTTMYRLYGEVTLPEDVKKKLYQGGVKIVGINVAQSGNKYHSEGNDGSNLLEMNLPKTVYDLVELYKKVIASLERELAIKDKYIALLESRIK